MVIQNNNYLVDLSFRQFLTKEACDLDNYVVIDDMVVKAPAPGFYMTRSIDGIKLANKLMEDGYVKLTNSVAKIYGDSFYYTKTGYINYSNISENTYLDLLTKENSKYADSDEKFNEMYRIRI